MQQIKQEEKYSLSSTDLKRLVPGCKILTYPQLANVKRVQDLLQNKAQCCFILVPIESAVQGHWECVFRAPDGLHFFDPVGCSVDSARLFASKGLQRQLHDSQPLLLPLLQKCGEQWHANTHDYQSCAPGVCTCGRHCVCRIWHRELTDDAYAQWMANFEDPDEEVVKLTASVLGK